MSLSTWLALALLLVQTAVAQETPSPTQEAAPPKRLLLVDVDDLGWEFLEEHGLALLEQHGDELRTYRRFYTASVCTPTRAWVQLGAYGSHPDVLTPDLITARGSWALPLDGPLLPLARAVVRGGRTTAKVGKWHLAPPSERSHPRDAGWQHYVGVLGNPGKEGYFVERVVRDDEWEERVGYLTTLETEDALAYLDADVDLVSVSYHAIHRPYHVPPPELAKVEDPEDDEDRARAALEVLGEDLVRLYERARERGYTVLLFSDNGGVTALGGGKGRLDTDGIHTPLWIAGPDVVPGEDQSLVSAVDLYRTVLEFFGLEASEGACPDSVSFLGTWRGAPGTRTWVYSEAYRGNGKDPRSAPRHWRRTVIGPRFQVRRNYSDTEPEGLLDLGAGAVPRHLEGHELDETSLAEYVRLRTVLDEIEAGPRADEPETPGDGD